MSERAEEAQTPESATLTNNDVKQHPLFIKLASELASVKAKADEIEKKRADEEKAKEIKEAEARKDYDKIVADLKAEHASSLQKEKDRAVYAELKSVVIANGGLNAKGFHDVIFAEYRDKKPASIDDFVASLKNDENYKGFFGAQISRPTPPLDGGKTNNDGARMTDALALQYEKSNDPNLRAKARAYFVELYKAGKSLPKG